MEHLNEYKYFNFSGTDKDPDEPFFNGPKGGYKSDILKKEKMAELQDVFHITHDDLMWYLTRLDLDYYRLTSNGLYDKYTLFLFSEGERRPKYSITKFTDDYYILTLYLYDDNEWVVRSNSMKKLLWYLIRYKEDDTFRSIEDDVRKK